MKNIKVKGLSLLILLFAYHTALAQTAPFGNKVKWLSGFQKEISGETLTYFSAYTEYVNKALLTRATDGKKTIEWETATVTEVNEPYVYFRWVAGHSTGTSKGNRNFDLYINGEKALTFTTKPGNKTPVWSFGSADSTRLTFVKLKTDAANDAHGLAYLRVPSSKIRVGQAVKLKIVGQNQDSNDWFMTFKYAFEERADLTALPFLYKNGKQPLLLNVLHFGKKEKLQVKLNDKAVLKIDLKEGMNTFEIPINAVKKTDSIKVLVKAGSRILADRSLVLHPITFRELHFIHHSHTDIGYSHLQPEVEKIHNKDIDDALRMIEKTKSYPVEAKFKWNVESLWVVENYLKQADGATKEKFFTAVKNGDILLSGLYANILTGLSMPEEMLHYTDYAQYLRQHYQLPINSAMASDVPGFSWATVSALVKGGIKYFSSGPNYLGPNNPYLGDRVGNFVKTWGDKPVYWTSPSGKEKVLFWAGGRGYSSWHGNAPGAVFENGAKKIATYLDELEAKKYPYDMVQWRYNIVADNGPIDSTISDFVKQWNAKYTSPKIVLNTTDQLFKQFEDKYGSQLETVKGDMTPYWEDGAASTANEEGQNRANSLRLQQLTTLYSILDPAKYQSQQFDEAWKNILLFHEHTWGAHNSTTEPNIPFVTEQWRIKKDFMLTADRQINTLNQQLLQPITTVNAQKIAVINTLSWKRNGTVYLPSNFGLNTLRDDFGNQYPLQNLADGRKVFMAERLSPLSVTYFTGTNAILRPRSQFVLTDTTLSNGLITIKWDNKTGSIKQLQNIEGYSFAGDFKNQGLNGYWYVPGRNADDVQTNSSVVKKIEDRGTLVTTISFTSPAPGAQSLIKKISLFMGDDRVFIENIIDKKKVEEKEAVYFSFPFASSLTQVSADAGYGTLVYMKDQLPGSNFDFLSQKRWLDVADHNKGVQLLMIEPFMIAPKMVDERLVIDGSHKKWKSVADTSATWFSYVMNNYWHTNYKASQDGVSHYRYVLRPHGRLKNFEQEKAAMEFNQPLIAFPVNEGGGLISKSLFALSNNKIVVTSITPQSVSSYKVRLFNPEEAAQLTNIKWQNLKGYELYNLANNTKIDLTQLMKLDAFEVLDILIKVN